LIAWKKISNSGSNAYPTNQKYGSKTLLKSLLTTKKAQTKDLRGIF
jgi:hypothetical protein